MTDANRRRLSALVSAGTKLDAAARLVKEASVDLAITGLPREPLRQIAETIETRMLRIADALNEVPST